MMNGIGSEDGDPPRRELTPEARSACAVGRERLIQHVRAEFLKCLYTPSICPVKNCQSPPKCKAAFLPTISKLCLWDTSDGDMHVLETPVDVASEFCKECRSKVLLPFFEETVRKLWNALPTFFDLPHWDELVDLDV